jgi:glutamyl-tRNA reductase
LAAAVDLMEEKVGVRGEKALFVGAGKTDVVVKRQA